MSTKSFLLKNKQTLERTFLTVYLLFEEEWDEAIKVAEDDKSYNRTRVYDWNESSFARLESVGEKIGTASTATEARIKLQTR